MRYLATTCAAAALLPFTWPASAQMYPTYSPTWQAPQPGYSYYSSASPEMIDNGCCTDFPTHTASDFMSGPLNQQVLNYNAQPPVYPAPVYMPR